MCLSNNLSRLTIWRSHATARGNPAISKSLTVLSDYLGTRDFFAAPAPAGLSIIDCHLIVNLVLERMSVTLVTRGRDYKLSGSVDIVSCDQIAFRAKSIIVGMRCATRAGTLGTENCVSAAKTDVTVMHDIVTVRQKSSLWGDSLERWHPRESPMTQATRCSSRRL